MGREMIYGLCFSVLTGDQLGPAKDVEWEWAKGPKHHTMIFTMLKNEIIKYIAILLKHFIRSLG